MNPIVWLLVTIIDLINMVLFAWIIVSLLIHFNIVNRYQPLVRKIMQVLDQLLEPMLRPIRRYVPMVAGLDLSPMVLVIGLQFISHSLQYYLG